MSCFSVVDDKEEKPRKSPEGSWRFWTYLNPLSYCWSPKKTQVHESVVENIETIKPKPIGPRSSGINRKTDPEIRLLFSEEKKELQVSPSLPVPKVPKPLKKDMLKMKRVADRVLLYWNKYNTIMPDKYYDTTPPEMVEELNFIQRERDRKKTERQEKIQLMNGFRGFVSKSEDVDGKQAIPSTFQKRKSRKSTARRPTTTVEEDEGMAMMEEFHPINSLENVSADKPIVARVSALQKPYRFSPHTSVRPEKQLNLTKTVNGSPQASIANVMSAAGKPAGGEKPSSRPEEE